VPDVVFVTRHGKLSGLLVPLGSPQDLPVYLRQDLLEKLGEAISRHLSVRGVGEAAATSQPGGSGVELREMAALYASRRSSSRRSSGCSPFVPLARTSTLVD